MDLLYLILSFIMMVLGLIGCFVPLIPGPLSSWFGFLFLYQHEGVTLNKTILITTFIVSVIVFVIDYFIPIIGAKVFGGSKNGIFGTIIGLVIGIIFLGPFGLIIGPFLGAFIGELFSNGGDTISAIKASMHTIISMIGGFFLKFSITCMFILIYFFEIWNYKYLII
mgnify:CR=1 FL=1